ncbi:MAG: signal peptide peptidase SppA [Candidatus Binataceae bacterium]
MTRKARVIALVLAILLAGLIAFVIGWHVTAGALTIAALALAAAYFFLVFRPARIPAHSLLRARLSGAVHEHSAGSLLDRIRGHDFVTMHQLRDALEHAARDSALTTVMVEIAGVSCGIASALELHDLLAAVGRGGKRTIAVLDSEGAGPREYLIAAGAGEIVVNPDTTLEMLGVSAGSFFLKRALSNLHIEAQTLQWKEYKGAGEMTSREHMSPEVRESVEAVVGDCEKVLVDYLARSRRLAPQRARELLNCGFLSAQAARDCGLADRLGYAQDVAADFEDTEEREPAPPLIERLLRGPWRRQRGKPAGNRIVKLDRYLRRTSYLDDKGRRPRIALVYGLGPVVSGDAPRAGEFISGQQTATELLRAAEDPRVRALIFRVNSPGGSAIGSDLVWRAVTEVQRRGKPVVVSMGDVAGSGGYYVAASADAIVAQPATITGSIGVVYTKFNLAGVLQRVGINVDYAKTAAISDALSITRPLTAIELDQLNEVMGELYANFSAKVAQGRKLDAAQTEIVARGRIWSGSAALANGLVDALGGMARAVELAREKAQLAPDEEHEIALYTSARGLMGLRRMLGSAVEPDFWAGPLARLTGIPEPWLPALAQLLSSSGTLLFCPWF